jgi:fructokinase
MIVVTGEALIDMNPIDLGGQTAYLPHPGGSPYNVAMGVGRLGSPVWFLGRLSNDGFGQRLRSHLQDSQVNLDYVVEGSELTTLAMVTLSPSREPIFSFYCENTADRLLRPDHLPERLPEGALLHFGSISMLLEPTASTIEALVQREAGARLITLDPNVRPFLIPDKSAYLQRLQGWLALSDLVKVSQADLEWLYPGRPLEEVAAEWRSYGPELIVITRGGEGAMALSRQGFCQAAAPRVEVADTVGAGDAFMGGALHWLEQHQVQQRTQLAALTQEQIVSMLAFSARVAALTCTRSGANPPWREEVSQAPDAARR